MTTRAHRTVGLAAIAAVAAINALVLPATAHADTTGTVKARTQRMSDANLTSQQDGWYNVGDKLTLVCSKRGQNVKGYFSFNIPNGGWDNLWYRTSDGHFVADVDIETGTLDVVTGPCDAPPPADAGAAPASAKAEHAVAWANGMDGSDDYDFACGRFIANAYGKNALGYGSAIEFFNALNGAGKIHTSPAATAPAGALVFSKSSYDQGFGHVVIARGDGSFVSGGVSKTYGSGHTVQVLSSANPSPGAQYLGWADAPADWPGR